MIIHISNCELKCFKCNENSKKLNLCLSCNTAKGYFPVNYNNEPQLYYECFSINEKHKRFFFDNKKNEFKPCYETCLTCNKQGNKVNHNCLSCEIDYRFKPFGSPTNNCVANCTYFYISSYGQYKCLKSLPCPIEVNLLIKEKFQCIDDCKKDNEYKYQYNGYCLKNCPEKTLNDNYLCKDISTYNCTLSENNNDFNCLKRIYYLE